MNGIMPGPLWLAMASAANSTSHENRNLNQDSKNDNVTRKMIENQIGPADSGIQPVADVGVGLRQPAGSRQHEGG